MGKVEGGAEEEGARGTITPTCLYTILDTVFIMNLLSYQDVEKYLQNKQVYFKKEIANSDFQTIAESGKVHNVGKVQLTRLNEQQVAFDLNVNGITTTMYEYKTDLELFAWVKTNFIPVCELVERWMS